jgi:hypothetical protein
MQFDGATKLYRKSGFGLHHCETAVAAGSFDFLAQGSGVSSVFEPEVLKKWMRLLPSLQCAQVTGST